MNVNVNENPYKIKINTYYGEDDFVTCMTKVIKQVNGQAIRKIELSAEPVYQGVDQVNW